MNTTCTHRSSTDCCRQPLLFDKLASRQVVADFSGGHVSCNGGLLLLRQVDGSVGMTRKLSRCFRDHRDPRFVEHGVSQLLAQRILPLAAGYEDLNDQQQLRVDPLLAVAVGKADPLGQDRVCAEDRGKPLAAPCTLNRLELTNQKPASRYHKIEADEEAITDCLLQLGVSALDKDARELIVDVDLTGVLLHGLQQGRHYSAYYGDYCYTPLLVFVGAVPLWAQLLTADRDATEAVVPALVKVVAAIRRRCPQARVIVRGDSEFCREPILAWCEQQRPVVYYCVGMGRNPRLVVLLGPAVMRARATACLTGGVARAFTEFEYQTLETWSRARRVIGKAEMVAGEDNLRFVVTNLAQQGRAKEDGERFWAQPLYEQLYCGRGEMENQIKQQQLDLFGKRLSTHWLGANQLRLWFSAFAQGLVERLRVIGLRGTAMATATAGTIRSQLLKVGAIVTVSVRRVYVQLSSSFVRRDVFERAQRALAAASG